VGRVFRSADSEEQGSKTSGHFSTRACQTQIIKFICSSKKLIIFYHNMFSKRLSQSIKEKGSKLKKIAYLENFWLA